MQTGVTKDLEALVFSNNRGNIHFTGVFAPYTTQTPFLGRFFGTGAILYADSTTIIKPTYKKGKKNEQI